MFMREGALLYVDRACARFTCQVLDRLAFCQGSQAFRARVLEASRGDRGKHQRPASLVGYIASNHNIEVLNLTPDVAPGRVETRTRWPERFPCAVETGVEGERTQPIPGVGS